VRWDNIKVDPPPNLKLSPAAAVPHKTKTFRQLLDLTFALQAPDGTICTPVNVASPDPNLPSHSKFEMGNVISHIIWQMARATQDLPFFLQNLTSMWKAAMSGILLTCYHNTHKATRLCLLFPTLVKWVGDKAPPSSMRSPKLHRTLPSSDFTKHNYPLVTWNVSFKSTAMQLCKCQPHRDLAELAPTPMTNAVTPHRCV
jgi:hypothetical protein